MSKEAQNCILSYNRPALSPMSIAISPLKIMLLLWEGSGNDILRSLLRLAGHELAALGYEIHETTMFRDGWERRLIDAIGGGGFAFALAMSGVGVEIAAQAGGAEVLLWDAARLPLFNWNCDHPAYYPTRHVVRSRHVLHGYVFPDHARYAARHLRANGAAYAVHLGIPDRALFPAAPRPLAARNGRILLAKTGGDPEAVEATWRSHVDPIGRILFAAAEELRGARTARFLPTLQRIAERHGLYLEGAGALALQMLQELDSHSRARNSTALLRAALDYPVDVYGGGWAHLRSDRPHARLFDAVPWPVLAERLPEYLGCLSLNPLIDASAHDRVFCSLAANVAPISDGNAFSRRHMPALEPYSFALSAEGAAAALQAVLDAPAEALARTEATYLAMLPEFSMRAAMQRIVALAGLAHANSAYGGA
jgi:hypothetical protein